MHVLTPSTTAPVSSGQCPDDTTFSMPLANSRAVLTYHCPQLLRVEPDPDLFDPLTLELEEHRARLLLRTAFRRPTDRRAHV